MRRVVIPLSDATLEGDLEVAGDATGLVVFAHGSGSSSRSPRNQFVAQELRDRGVGTLLFDLLTADEERVDAVSGRLRFDVGLLAARLGAATDWVRGLAGMEDLPVGYFGASTGAAAALIAAAARPTQVLAIVSRGGRPDLARGALARVRAPTLLIVGGADATVLELNREALERISAPKQLSIVPGATHLFAEPGALTAVAHLAGDWFARYLGS